MADDRDIDRLDRRVDQLDTRLQGLDEHGSRGVISLQVQVNQLTTEIAKVEPAINALRQEMKNQFTLHEASHMADAQRRTSRMRWFVATALTVGGLGGGFVGHIIEKVVLR